MKDNDDGNGSGLCIELPPFIYLGASIGPLIRNRRSVRDFSGGWITLHQLSSVLYHAAGITGKKPPPGNPETPAPCRAADFYVRAAPSFGSLYPVSLYLLAFGVTGLDPGVYAYRPDGHALEKVCAQENHPDFGMCSICIAYCYEPPENSGPIGDTGLPHALIEAGAISCLVHLGCAALGLGSCDRGGVEFAGHLADIDGRSRHIMHCTAIGPR